MSDLPILFQPDMVRAILAGRKTETRRLLYVARRFGKSTAMDRRHPPPTSLEGLKPGYVWTLSPWFYARPGDRLWGRENWAPLTKGYAYGADPIWQASPAGRWHPSIHMPRDACRLWLPLLEVRIERLHDISDLDAEAEGCEPAPMSMAAGVYSPMAVLEAESTKYRDGYRLLWQRIHGRRSWDVNPWVVVLCFKRGQGGADVAVAHREHDQRPVLAAAAALDHGLDVEGHRSR